MVLVHTRKNFSENYPQFWHLQKYSPAKFEEFRFKCRYNISLPGASICLGPALDYVIFAIYFSNFGFGKYHCNVVQFTYK